MNIKEVLSKFEKFDKKLRIAVLGDCLIDDYKYGQVNRVSPEAPIVVLNSLDGEGKLCCGGVANVCNQMFHMNVDVFLIGLIDTPARNLYENYSFNIEYCINLNHGNVPIKVRFYDGDFPLFRWDIEKLNYGEENLSPYHDLIINKFESLVNSVKLDAVILSDYDKGFWSTEVAQEVIRICNERNILTVVDPKKLPLEKWQGCDVIKPNASEAKLLTSEVDVKKQLNCLCKVAKTAIITNAGSGIVGQDVDFFECVPNKHQAKGVNFIGAGDAFTSMLTLGLSHGLTVQESALFAFYAGTAYIKSKHNQPVSLYDIKKQIDPELAKLIKPEELKLNKEKIVFCNGVFDIVHFAHLDTLKFAKQQGDKLVVGINSDSSVRRLKGEGRPINDIDSRVKMLSAIECVDYIVVFDEDTPMEVMLKFNPSIVVKGGDYQKNEVIAPIGTEIIIAPYVSGISTTKIINKIQSNHK